MTKLKVYELKIDGTTSLVDKISIVKNPAIEKDFIAFSKQTKFEFNDEKMQLVGPAMIPDQLIYRRDEDGSEYNVFFSADTISQVENVYFKNGFQNAMNIEHSEKNADSYVFESFIINKKEGINPKQFSDLPDGSWVIKVQVNSSEVWSEIKNGERKGFSVEGVFQILESNKNDFNINDKEEIDELIENIKGLNQLLESINY